jgi:hypothetical protein
VVTLTTCGKLLCRMKIMAIAAVVAGFNRIKVLEERRTGVPG